jgi:hypothetical protein
MSKDRTMSAFEVIIERKEAGSPHGFEIGDMTFVGSHGTASTKDPPRGVMIYISIVGLLGGLSRFISRHEQRHEFVGIDSSFSLVFRSRKTGVSVWYRKAMIADIATRDLAEGILEGVNRFLSYPDNRLTEADPVAGDLSTALVEFGGLLAKLRLSSRSDEP